MAIFISDETDFKTMIIVKGKRYSAIIKWSNPQEDIILHVYTSKNRS